MELLSVSLGTAFILIILWDAFETIVLPRRVTRRIRFARFFYRSTWRPYSKLVCLISSQKRRESYLSYFGPISLLILLTVWASGLIVGFALIFWAEDSILQSREIAHSFFPSFYMSGTNFFTLGLGDITPRTTLARLLVMIEAGMGFGFLALVIGYLPVLNQLFSRREVNVSLMDARAG